MTNYRKAIKIVGGVLAIYALLVASHKGEFWPFSIYPMFSQAGNPWTRAMVRELPNDPERVSWEAADLSSLPGSPYPVEEHGINQNDVSNYVSKTTEWTPQRLRGFRSLFARNHDFARPLLVLKVRGTLQGDSVWVQATPFMLLEQDTTRFSPESRLDSSLAVRPSVLNGP
jgi:hypothetical protein